MLQIVWCSVLVLFFVESYGAPAEIPPPYEPPGSEEIYEEHAMKIFEVPKGKVAKLSCGSNDKDHNFAFWEVHNDELVGPGNKYDRNKYDYEILTGKLIIWGVTPQEEGTYTCVSKGVRNNNSYNTRSVRMVVKSDWEEVYESDPNVNFFRVVIVLASLLIIMGLIYAAYRIRKRHRLHEYLENSEDDDDEESADEIFRAPGTSRGTNTGNIVLDKSVSIDTDFGSILDHAQQKD